MVPAFRQNAATSAVRGTPPHSASAKRDGALWSRRPRPWVQQCAALEVKTAERRALEEKPCFLTHQLSTAHRRL
ncbi:hypothetical protein JZ751_003824 [Albula glossodonta]|uniref:Uncharacterized protein n=1 Tax=Albula glossodonta TaxID=121402 RepID=A0A8T2P696_9TELE|nr:hypothetical protein JZ751_003824 [Albula glossodonta]